MCSIYSVLSVNMKKETLNLIFRYAFYLSVAFSPIWPVVHYSLWIICLPFAIQELKCNNWRPRVTIYGYGKYSMMCLLLAAVWICVAGLFTYTEAVSYVKNVSVLIEVIIGAYFATQTLETEQWRVRFLKILVIGSLIILLGNILRMTGCISFFPNRSLKNGNSMGCLAILLFPIITCYALWNMTRMLIRMTLLLPSIIAVVLSFSSGAWLSALVGGMIILYYAIRMKRITLHFLIIGIILFCTIIPAIDFLANGKFSRRLAVEVSQVKAIDDMNKFTTLRNQIWRACWYMTNNRPILGYGGDLYINQYRILDSNLELAKKIGLTVKREVNHPHSTYFNLLYLGGIPALVLFCAMLLLLLRKMRTLITQYDKSRFPWAITSFVLLVEIMIYGTNGDILTARRDAAVIVWCFFGIMAVLPELHASEGEVNE